MHDVLNCNNNQSSTHPLWNRFPIGRQVLLKIKPGKNTSQRTGGKGNSDNCENFGCWPTKMRSMYFLLPEVISLSLTPGFIFSFRKSRKSLKGSEGTFCTLIYDRGAIRRQKFKWSQLNLTWPNLTVLFVLCPRGSSYFSCGV